MSRKVWCTTAAALTAATLMLTAHGVRASTRVYVANLGADSVSAIEAGVVTATIPVGDDPDGIAATADGARVWVANFLSDTVSVIDTSLNTVIATIAVGSGPVGVAVAPDGASVYVTNRGSNSVSIIDTATQAVTSTISVGDGPNAVALTPDGRLAYVTNSFTRHPGTVSVIDTSTRAVTATIEVQRTPNRVAVSSTGQQAYVTNFRSGNIAVIDVTRQQVVDYVPLAGRPTGIAVHPNGSLLYVSTLGGRLWVIDAATYDWVESITVGTDPYGIATTPIGDRAYVANFEEDSVSIVDLVNMVEIDTYFTATRPFAVAVVCQGDECAAPPHTPGPPRPTRPPTPSAPPLPTLTLLPQASPTGLPTASPSPTVAATLSVGNAQGQRGGRVSFGVVLSTNGLPVVAAQNDIGFDPDTPIAVRTRNRPDCTVNPAIDKPATSFAFQPPNCQPGVDCIAIRAVVLAVDNQLVIPDGAELYRCNIEIAADAAPGSHPLTTSLLIASDPVGNVIPLRGVNGHVSVLVGAAQLGIVGAESSTGCNVGPADGSAIWLLAAAGMLIWKRKV